MTTTTKGSRSLALCFALLTLGSPALAQDPPPTPPPEPPPAAPPPAAEPPPAEPPPAAPPPADAPPPAAPPPASPPPPAVVPPPPPPAGQAASQPPPPGRPETAQEKAEREKKEKEKEKEKGRGLSWVWLEAEGGFEQVDLRTFSADATTFTAGIIPTSSIGGVMGVGAGVRLVFVTLGARGRVGFFDAWQLFSLDGELGFRIPLGNFEPHLQFDFGYSGLGSFGGALSGAADAISVHGYNVRVGGGLDYFITPIFSVGLNASFEGMVLTRPAVDALTIAQLAASGTPPSVTQALALNGSSAGDAFALTAVAGVHF